jgi:uncharacterized protein (UPF0261 family)
MTTILVLGTFDTKGAEYSFVIDRILRAGHTVLTVDTGVFGGSPLTPDVPAEEVARLGGSELGALADARDRGDAVLTMARGASLVTERLLSERRIDGALALGGTGGTSVAAEAFRVLPLGFPKIIVSTAASGETSQYIGETDLILAPSVVDIAGLNRISAPLLANAVDAVLGMATGAAVALEEARPLVAASMFGVTTPCVTRARGRLDEAGFEALTFHMTGTGGRSMEALIQSGTFDGVLDLTTTELADELVGGVFSAGPDRLRAAAVTGTPQVVSVGALDMVNFGPEDTVPERFRDRTLYRHNASVTLMRTTAEECAELGRRLAARVRDARGPAVVMLPLRGVSAISTSDGPFADAEADTALFDAVRSGLEGSPVTLLELDTDINDPDFADTAVDELLALITGRKDTA